MALILELEWKQNVSVTNSIAIITSPGIDVLSEYYGFQVRYQGLLRIVQTSCFKMQTTQPMYKHISTQLTFSAF